jgi:hypothetical protein
MFGELLARHHLQLGSGCRPPAKSLAEHLEGLN